VTAEEYQATQDQLLLIAEIVSSLDLDSFLAAIDHADSIGCLLDPAAYRAGQATMHAIGDVARAARQVQKAFAKLREVAP
jgi:hypothetical protein